MNSYIAKVIWSPGLEREPEEIETRLPIMGNAVEAKKAARTIWMVMRARYDFPRPAKIELYDRVGNLSASWDEDDEVAAAP